MEYKARSVKQRLGNSKSKKSILNRIGSASRSTTESAGISSSLKSRLNKTAGVSKSSHIIKRPASEPWTRSGSGSNKLLFKRAIAESTSFEHPLRSSGLRAKKSIESEDQPVNFRIPNGTIVKGLRSDSIILKKKNIAQTSKVSPSKRFPNSRIRVANRSRLAGQGKVSLTTERGLTVNIRNEQGKRRLQARPLPRRTIQNDIMSSDDEYMSEDSIPLRKLNLKKMYIQSYLPPRNVDIESYLPTEKVSLQPYMPPIMSKIVVRQTPEVAPPPPPQLKLHKQILDSDVQSEIAALQGKQETVNSGPGPGVKSFKMIPVITKKPLTDRFKQEGN